MSSLKRRVLDLEARHRPIVCRLALPIHLPEAAFVALVDRLRAEGCMPGEWPHQRELAPGELESLIAELGATA